MTARPPYLRLLAQHDRGDAPPGAASLSIEKGPGGEELSTVTIERDPRLLSELRLRFGDRLALRRVTPGSLTFAIEDAAADRKVISIFSRRRPAVA